jgi:hypothetical protein
MTTKRRFTDQMLDRLNPPQAGRLELADDVFPGLVLRVMPSGAKTFGTIYRVPGEGGLRRAHHGGRRVNDPRIREGLRVSIVPKADIVLVPGCPR